MDGKTFKKLRESYLNLLIYTLNNNIKKTLKNVNIDESVIQHYGLTIEEDCFSKNPSDLAPYTKAITAARLNIESYTEKQQPYPMIANALDFNEMEQLPKENPPIINHANDETNRPENDPTTKQEPNSTMTTDVIVIDSDSEDELCTMITDDMKSQKSNNNNSLMGEILVSVQTKPTKTDEQ